MVTCHTKVLVNIQNNIEAQVESMVVGFHLGELGPALCYCARLLTGMSFTET